MKERKRLLTDQTINTDFDPMSKLLDDEEEESFVTPIKNNEEFYSSGESVTMFEVKYSDLNAATQTQRILFLWELAMKKALAASMLLNFEMFCNNDTYNRGLKRRSNVQYF